MSHAHEDLPPKALQRTEKLRSANVLLQDQAMGIAGEVHGAANMH